MKRLNYCVVPAEFFTIIAHGGAAKYSESEKKECVKGVEQAVAAGYEILKNGGSAIDAVKATVISLENNPLFNAGYGSCLNEMGEVEMDSMIMNGTTYEYGAVVSVDCVKNPVELAYNVMKETPHCILSGEGARKFAKSIDMPVCDNAHDLITKSQMEIFKTTPSFKDWIKSDMASTSGVLRDETQHDTVGAVALDSHGNLACATSTGGINGKMLGRIGDSAIIGCGGYANEFGAAAATGHGESFLKVLACHSTVEKIENGQHPSDAASNVLQKISHLLKSKGGIISVNKDGEIGYAYTTEFLPWAAYDKNGCLRNSLETASKPSN